MAWCGQKFAADAAGPIWVTSSPTAPTNWPTVLPQQRSLEFYEEGDDLPEGAKPDAEIGYFAGGCFWGVEHGFALLPGVLDVVSGYQQGTVDRPEYKAVCVGTTGHAESVKVVFDPDIIDFGTLCKYFMYLHDPTQLNRRGPTEAPNTALGFTPSVKSNSTPHDRCSVKCKPQRTSLAVKS